MTQEEKDLLYEDLCARLLYGVKVKVTPVPGLKHLSYDAKLFNINTNNIIGIMPDDNSKYIPHNIEEIKPYLSPLSSMTKEQKEELIEVIHPKDTAILAEILRKKAKGESVNGYGITHHAADWCNKNHFDYRGLIPMGLAIDATNLNIY